MFLGTKLDHLRKNPFLNVEKKVVIKTASDRYESSLSTAGVSANWGEHDKYPAIFKEIQGIYLGKKGARISCFVFTVLLTYMLIKTRISSFVD